MTNEELKELQTRLDDMSAQLDAIMTNINKRQDEIFELWERYWRLFGELTEELKTDDVKNGEK